MASSKKTTTPKKSIEGLEAEVKMLRCLAEPKKPMLSDYKRTMINPHCAKRLDEILENEDEQISKFFLEAGLLLEQLHSQSKIQMAYAPKAWKVSKPMLDEKHFNNSTQTQHFHWWYLEQVKRGRVMFGFQYQHHHFYHGNGE
jgi:hypothetical protein